MSTTARGVEINHSEVPIRLFKSDFLEFFTHISPVAVLVIWVPVAYFFLVQAILDVTAGGAWWVLPVAFILGLALWTFTEYTLHRFLFHYHAKGSAPSVSFSSSMASITRSRSSKLALVMPPILSIPLALLFYGLFYFVIGQLLGVPSGWRPCSWASSSAI